MKSQLKSLTILSALLLAPVISSAADYNLRVQSPFKKTASSFQSQKAWLDSIESETDGRLKITLVPTGTVVAHNQTLDAMRLNLLDGHISLATFFSDKEPGFMLLTNAVGAWTSGKQASDFMKSDGEKILAKALKNNGAHLVGTFNGNVESFALNRPTNSPRDLKGAKLRVADNISYQLFQKYGAKPKSIPYSQVSDGLEQGALDGADASTLTDNQTSGINELATNPIYPGFHLPILDFSISEKSWNTLPSDLQQILTSSTKKFANDFLQKSLEADKKTLKELNANSKINISNWSQTERKKFRETAKAQWKTVSEKSPLASEAYGKLIAYLEANNLL